MKNSYIASIVLSSALVASSTRNAFAQKKAAEPEIVEQTYFYANNKVGGKFFTAKGVENRLTTTKNELIEKIASTASGLETSLKDAKSEINTKLADAEVKAADQIKLMESKLLSAIQNLDQRILAEEVMKNMREEIKAELREELLKELEAKLKR